MGIPGRGEAGKVGVEEVLPEELSGLQVKGERWEVGWGER